MIRYEDDCCDCQMNCNNCGKRNSMHLYCDDCGSDVDELYDVDGEHLCIDCLLEKFPKVVL